MSLDAGSYDRAVMVTGASTGIGRAIAAKAAAGGAHVFASVRKQADAESLRAELGARVTPVVFDVVDEAGVRAGAEQVGAALANRRLFGLVNNAGIAVAGPLLHLDTEELARQLDVNLLGVHRVTRAFAPLLGADPDRTGKPGRIVMISSVGGRNASPMVGPYSASKFALEGYSQSLRRELMLHGVDVVVVGPGAIATPIWEKSDEEIDVTRFANTPYREMVSKTRDYMLTLGKNGLPPEDVGALVWRILNDPAPKVRYAILRNPFMDSFLPRVLPQRFVDRMVASRLGLTKA
jgi:NAD(P)-dependent dehydrogenase (short-subunit alcohol dehydrogenase family)